MALKRDEVALRVEPGPVAPARLLPSGDTFFLLHDDDRAILVPEADRRRALWTARVWPGGVLIEGEISGTWRRSQHKVTIQMWRRLSGAARSEVEIEAMAMPLPGITREIEVSWVD